MTVREIGDGEQAENGRENIVTNKIRDLKFCDVSKFSKISCPSFSYMYLINCSDSSFSFSPFHMDKCVD